MAVREIVLHTDNFIRKKSKPVKEFDEKLWELLDDMWDTLDVVPGSGLSAVQVGVLKRVFLLNINNMKIEFINPVITKTKGAQYKREGCLSVALAHDFVKRPFEVTVTAFDRYGNEFIITGVDLLARALNHEIDHLNGVLYIDKVIKDYKEKKGK